MVISTLRDDLFYPGQSHIIAVLNAVGHYAGYIIKAGCNACGSVDVKGRRVCVKEVVDNYRGQRYNTHNDKKQEQANGNQHLKQGVPQGPGR